MPQKGKFFIGPILWMLIVVLAGCMARPLILEDVPWYQKPSGLYVAGDERVFYGIGSAEGTRNMTLLRATAANRARKEMAAVLDPYVAELFHATRAMPALSMEEGEQVIGALVSSALKHAVISDQWSDPEKLHLSVLCRLDLETFKQVLASQSAIDAKVREAMVAEAEKVHARLEGELQ